MVAGINRMIHSRGGGGWGRGGVGGVLGLKKNALFFKQILSTNSFTKCMKICVENLYLYIGAHGVRVIPLK